LNSLKKLRTKFTKAVKRFGDGINKISDTELEVKENSKVIEIQKVEVEERKAVVENMIEEINKSTEIAGKQQVEAQTLKSTLDTDKIEISKVKKDAEEIMALALPALEDAKEQMKKVNEKDFQSLKALTNPPRSIEIIGKACAVLRPIPERPFGKGDWKSDVLPMIGDAKFVGCVKG